MATITLTGTPSLASVEPPPNHRLTGLLAGEAIAAGHLCYVKSDGLIWKATGAAATAPAQVRGMAMVAAQVGEAVTLYWGVMVRYGAGLTPGAKLFLSATAGLIDDAATTGGTAPIGWVKDATTIFVDQSHY